ncbi:TonB-dependent siderophore receptor [Sphingobium sp.]|uniref:TonB-dependent receptor plug domain-containing protein n=1 Tax=Sphingobium sp. TaxID=1912891 RepID=UPI00262D57A9|nr:TonB-dependent receptor [Sphingobium sp.]
MKVRPILCAATSVMAIAGWFSLAHAQEAPSTPSPAGQQLPADQPPEQAPANAADQRLIADIVVTGSRIARNGYSAPTPLTMMSDAELKQTTSPTIATALIQSVPALQASTTTNNSGNTTLTGGQNYLNLRNLQPQRTLVLLDGRRVAPTAVNGATDINLLSTGLVSRVDVVTGGASAAYGSDAVAGVVNFVLDTKFSGIKGELTGGTSQRADDRRWGLTLSAGTGFAQDRGHIIVSMEYFDSKGVLGKIDPQGKRSWQDDTWSRFNNPGATPNYVIGGGARLATGTEGGLITSGPLAGIEFGANGVPQQFVFGQYRGGGNQYTQGGSGENTAPLIPLNAPLERLTAFTHIRYDLTDDLTVYAEGSYGHSDTSYPSTQLNMIGSNAVQIQRDNAFLPTSIRDQMTALNLSNITIGKFAPRQLGILTPAFENETFRGVIGFDGKLGGNWTYGAYYQHGETQFDQSSKNNIILANFLNAIDAVVNPATGTITCRSTLTNPGNGCIPLNIMGTNVASPQAVDYVLGSVHAVLNTKQDVFSAHIGGDLPFSTWAGPISVAGGFDYRREWARRVSDPISTSPNPRTGAPGGFLFTNPQPLRGSYNVKEVYAEVAVPLAKDSRFAHSLDLNGAVRYTDYSTSGGVVTWKIGATYEPFADLRLRATRSRDIRAANINELYTSSLGFTGITDPENGMTYTVSPRLIGNPDLDPEKADTTTIGAIYRPSFLPGFGVSVDYYTINIKGAITTLNLQNQINECFAGNAALCALQTRGGPNNLITSIIQPFLNLQSLKTNGLDIDVNYRLQWGEDNSLMLRAIASRVGKLQTTTLGSAPLDVAGVVGTGRNGIPHWTGNATLRYDGGGNSVILRERFVGGGAFDPLLAPGYRIPSVFYTDLTVQRKFAVSGGEFEAFATVTNLFDRNPPFNPGTSTSSASVNLTLHDGVGRSFAAGLRFKF